MIAFCFYLHFTHDSNFFGNWGCKIFLIKTLDPSGALEDIAPRFRKIPARTVGQVWLTFPISQRLKVTFCSLVPSLPCSPISSLTPQEEAKNIEVFVTDLLVSHLLLFSFLPLLTQHTKMAFLHQNCRLTPPLSYFSPTCFHWGLITWWTE